jgi:hypothetical protein
VPPNAEVIQVLLERAIGLILAAAGYNGVDPDALQFLRVHVEECMCLSLNFRSHTWLSCGLPTSVG